MTPLAFAFLTRNVGNAGLGRRMLTVPRSRRRTSATSTRDCRPLQPDVSDPASGKEALLHSAPVLDNRGSTPVRPLGGVLA
jgi:hypothetical protein